MIIVLPLLVALIGLMMYFLSPNPKLQQIGDRMFFAGMLAFLMMARWPLTVVPGR